jgi:hypothetical protein
MPEGGDVAAHKAAGIRLGTVSAIKRRMNSCKVNTLLPRMCESGLDGSNIEAGRARPVGYEVTSFEPRSMICCSHSAAGLAGWRRKIRCNETGQVRWRVTCAAGIGSLFSRTTRHQLFRGAIASLEERLGTRLFHRSTRQFA